jgi:hypothetical protein
MEKELHRAEEVNSLCVWPLAKFSRQKSAGAQAAPKFI